MFNKIRLKEILAEYKKVFVQQQWPNEKYKWEAVQCFQENWDINSLDFAQMLKKSLNQVINVNIKMYIFDHLRMYIFAILPLDRYIF